MKKTVARIAREILRLETLERRNSDSLDFHDLSVLEIRDALEAAYRAGARSKSQPPHERELATVLNKLLATGQRLVEALEGTICADEPEFSEFADTLSAARQHIKGHCK